MQRSSLIPWNTASIVSSDANIGVIDNTRGNRHSLVLSGSGSRLPSLPLHLQLAFYQDVAETLKRTVSVDPKFAAEISFLFRRRPVDLWHIGAMLDSYLHPDVLEPPTDRPEETWSDYDHCVAFQHQLVKQTIEGAERDGGNVMMAAVLSIKEQGALAKAKKGKSILTERDLPKAPLIQMADTALSGLEAAGVSDVRLLDHDSLSLFLRQLWDVTTLDEYYQASLEDRRKYKLHWPQAYIRVGDSYCEVDGTFHTVLQISGSPTMQLPDYFRRLYAMNVRWLSIASVGETVRSRSEFFARSLVNEAIGGYAELYGSGTETLPAEQRKKQRDQQLRILHESGVAQRYNILVGLSNTTLEDLELDVVTAQRWIRTMNMESVRIDGGTLQFPAVLTANTGINML